MGCRNHKEKEGADAKAGNEDCKGLVAGPVDFQLLPFVSRFQPLPVIGKIQDVGIEVGAVAVDKVHQSFFEIDQKDGKNNEVGQG